MIGLKWGSMWPAPIDASESTPPCISYVCVPCEVGWKTKQVDEKECWQCGEPGVLGLLATRVHLRST